jgi:hypothetical protein
MKKLLFTTAIAICALQAYGQDAPKTEDNALKIDLFQSPKLVVGLQGTITNTPQVYRFMLSSENDMLSAGGSVFTRYYIGKHLALQGSFDYRMSEKEFGGGYMLYPYQLPANFDNVTSSRQFSYWDVAVQVQYYLLARGEKLRPYFFAGPGIVNYKHYFNNKIESQGSVIDNHNFTQTDNSLAVKLGQGITWDILPRLQLNESLSYQYEFTAGRNTFGLNLGVGYRVF